MTLASLAILAAISYMGKELPEGAEPEKILDQHLDEVGLTQEEFLTDATVFNAGYTRGLSGHSIKPDNHIAAGVDAGERNRLVSLMETAYCLGLELRDVKQTPPSSLVYEIYKEKGPDTFGQIVQLVNGTDLKETFRLLHAINIGSGKEAITVPAGTPVDVLVDDFEKDGVPHIVILWDGLPLLVPNPADAPNLVSGDTSVAPERRKSSKPRAAKGKGDKAPRVATARGPTLMSCILTVIEGGDGGPGPLQSDGAFAMAVRAEAKKQGIESKANKFVQEAARHVPYYLNTYRPRGENYTGRMGVEKPLAWVCAAISARKEFLKADGSFEQKVASLDADVISALADRETRLETVPKPEPEETPAAAPAEGVDAPAEAPAEA